jgi:hypothetical protein
LWAFLAKHMLEVPWEANHPHVKGAKSGVPRPEMAMRVDGAVVSLVAAAFAAVMGARCAVGP